MNAQGAGTGTVVSLGHRLHDAASPCLARNDLASLSGTSLASRYCAWRGGSDRRYVASVYAVLQGAGDAGLPDFESFVLMAVGCGPSGRRILDAAAIERDGDRHAAIARGLARGADEWHVHLLAEGRHARGAMVADLLLRHGDPAEARCA